MLHQSFQFKNQTFMKAGRMLIDQDLKKRAGAMGNRMGQRRRSPASFRAPGRDVATLSQFPHWSQSSQGQSSGCGVEAKQRQSRAYPRWRDEGEEEGPGRFQLPSPISPTQTPELPPPPVQLVCTSGALRDYLDSKPPVLEHNFDTYMAQSHGLLKGLVALKWHVLRTTWSLSAHPFSGTLPPGCPPTLADLRQRALPLDLASAYVDICCII